MTAALTPSLAADLLERCRRDPVFFCRKVLGVRPWARQVEALTALCDRARVAVRSGHGTGKTFTAAAAALWFLYAHYPAKVVTTAPTQTLVRTVLWNEIRRLHAGARTPLGGKVLDQELKLGPDAFAMGLSTDEPERFQGFHAERILVILDEAPGVREEVWEAAATLLTSAGARMLAIGNPTRADGPFRDCFAPASGWATVHISCLDSPNLDEAAEAVPALVTRAWIEQKKRDWGEASALYQSRVLGEFPPESDERLVPAAWLAAATARSGGAAEEADRDALLLGVDVARTGSDQTVLCLRDSRRVRALEAHSGWSTTRTAGRVAQFIREYRLDPSRVMIDDTGIGAGVTDRLREEGFAVRAVVLGASADDRLRFANVRAECFWRLREALHPEAAQSLSLPPADRDLLQELGSLRYELAGGGAIRIESKDALRVRLGRSTDRADALALTFAVRADATPSFTIL
jgi:hypothetical protein